jgi:hypothetical protein
MSMHCKNRFICDTLHEPRTAGRKRQLCFILDWRTESLLVRNEQRRCRAWTWRDLSPSRAQLVCSTTVTAPRIFDGIQHLASIYGPYSCVGPNLPFLLGLIITAAKLLSLTSTSGPPTGEAAACDARLLHKLPSRGGATHAHFIPPAASTTTPPVLGPPPSAGEESRRPGRLRQLAVSNLPSSPKSALASPSSTRAAQVPLASPPSRTLIRVAVLCAWDFGLAGVFVSRVDVCSAWGARGVCGLGRWDFFFAGFLMLLYGSVLRRPEVTF